MEKTLACCECRVVYPNSYWMHINVKVHKDRYPTCMKCQVDRIYQKGKWKQ